MNDTTGVMEAEGSGTDAYCGCELESISWIKEMPETDLITPLLSKLDDEVKKHSSTLYKGIGTEIQGGRQDAIVPLEAIPSVEVGYHDSPPSEMNRVASFIRMSYSKYVSES